MGVQQRVGPSTVPFGVVTEKVEPFSLINITAELFHWSGVNGHERNGTIEARDVARYGRVGVPLWSQAWGRDSPENARKRDARPSPVGLPPAGGTVRDRCKEDWAADKGGGLNGSVPGCLGWL
ncbi:hypothetical protein CRENBAI_019534 [Crenichthys baileyi]|uniref:Uncharacterized protein n=1 Tax=Crenichthys baileyi TaxID=28760 RepID=A0AAV9QZV9_9TELE